jgi:hypothetical protein
VAKITLKEWRIIFINISNPIFIVQKIAKEGRLFLSFFPKATTGIELCG